jgi:hypothetical protein
MSGPLISRLVTYSVFVGIGDEQDKFLEVRGKDRTK